MQYEFPAGRANSECGMRNSVLRLRTAGITSPDGGYYTPYLRRQCLRPGVCVTEPAFRKFQKNASRFSNMREYY